MVDFYGTVRQQKNIPSFDNALNIDLRKVFFSQKNQLYLANKLYIINKENGGKEPLEQFNSRILPMMERYDLLHDVGSISNTYYTDDANTTVTHLGLDTHVNHMGTTEITKKVNWLESFRALNKKFINWASSFLKWNRYVPFRESTTTGVINEFENTVRDVRNFNLLHEDKQQINVWKQYDINTDRSKYRYNNTIPFWQYTMNIRHYDRSNEGLREGNDPWRSSLENPVYAYDMRKIKDLKSQYQDEKWFGY